MKYVDQHLLADHWREPDHHSIETKLRQIYPNKKPIKNVSHLRHSHVDNLCSSSRFIGNAGIITNIRLFFPSRDFKSFLICHYLDMMLWWPKNMVMPLVHVFGWKNEYDVAEHTHLFRTGCWAYGESEDAILYVTNPKLYVDRRRRYHREDGPAIDWLPKVDYSLLLANLGLSVKPEWIDGKATSEKKISTDTDWDHYQHYSRNRFHPNSKFVWNGIVVPDWVILHPEKITPRDIVDELNQEVRWVMTQRIDKVKLATQFGRKVQQDDAGILWRLQIPRKQGSDSLWFNLGNREWRPDFDEILMVEVVNGTPEPDGSYKRYFLRVPPNMSTATEAVAWTYGLSVHQYKNLVVRT